jgi:Protein of unknown function (DUF3602)
MPSSRNYSIIEPHPTATSNSYITTGRGGVGNLTKVPSTVTRGSDASGPASHFPSLAVHSKPRPFMTGRGGAGNYKQPPSERAIFSFDEELERQLSLDRHAAPVYHVGRGGAGNVYGRERLPERRKSSGGDSESQKSDSSIRSADSGADVATRQLKKGWKKITGVY